MPLSKWEKFNAAKMPLAKWNKRIANLTAKAEANDPEAQWELGSLLDGGLLDHQSGESFAIKPNQRAALAWFRRSAQGGSPSGQISLGNYLDTGQATPKNEAEALLWYKRAFRQGDACAAFNIARTYENRNQQRRAFFWYQRAAALNDSGALVELGFRYYDGHGVTRNPKRAVDSFRQVITDRSTCSQADFELAMFGLGRAYHEGRGVKQSNDKALEWLLKANVDDDLPAARKLIKEISRQRAPRHGRK